MSRIKWCLLPSAAHASPLLQWSLLDWRSPTPTSHTNPLPPGIRLGWKNTPSGVVTAATQNTIRHTHTHTHTQREVRFRALWLRAVTLPLQVCRRACGGCETCKKHNRPSQSCLVSLFCENMEKHCEKVTARQKLWICKTVVRFMSVMTAQSLEADYVQRQEGQGLISVWVEMITL